MPRVPTDSPIEPEVQAGASDYQPCFSGSLETYLERWQAIRTFVTRWHGIPLSPAGASSAVAEGSNAQFGLRLPPSFHEYVAFADELSALPRKLGPYDSTAFSILRDNYRIERLEDHQATSLMLQGEGDFYWAVRDEYLTEDDPPVDGYHLTDDAGTFEYFGAFGPITTFILDHMTGIYLRGRGGSFNVDIDPTDAILKEMRASFQVYAEFGPLRIFEMEKIIAHVRPNPYGDPTDPFVLTVEVWRPIPRERIPACVLALVGGGG